MARSVINLLPPELLNTQKKQRTLATFVWLASISLIVVIVLTASILLYKLYQIQQLNIRHQDIQQLNTQVSSLQAQEGILYTVHARLNDLSQISQQNQTPLSEYSLTQSIVPSGFKILAFSNDTLHQVKLSVESTGSAKLKNLFDNLTNPQVAEGKILKSNLDSLSRNSLDQYKADLTINYQ